MFFYVFFVLIVGNVSVVWNWLLLWCFRISLFLNEVVMVWVIVKLRLDLFCCVGFD